MKAIVALGTSLMLTAGWLAKTYSAPPVPDDLLILRCQPAVFKVEELGSPEVMHPSAYVRMDILEAQDRQNPDLDLAKANRLWKILFFDPETYLAATSETEKYPVPTEIVMGWGTAFAVSREGILLTNAHVFGDDKFGPPLNSSDPLVASFLKKAAEDLEARLKSEIVETLGRESPPWRRARFNAEDVDSVEHQTVITKLTDWLAKRAGINAKFSSARIVLDSGFGPSALSDKPHGQVFADVEVLKIGQPWPGKDVAVLRLYDRVLANANRDRTGEKAAEGAKYMGLSDKLICLPLGNSDDVYPGTQIHSFGFPGLGIFPEFTESAKDVVDVRIGELGNKKETFGGWEAFPLTANITHGDSGGPVVDRNGNAVAINVAGGEITAGQGMAIPTGFNVAIPINLAKGFLEQAGVKPDPGPLLQLWQEALTFYSQGKYDRALERFKALDNKIDETPDPTSTPSLLQKFHNRYVALMELRTRDRMKEQH